MSRCRPVDLLAQLPDEDVDRPVAMRRPAAPHALEELVACEDAAHLEGERVDEPELRRRQIGAPPVDVGLHVLRVEAELLDHEHLASTRVLRPGAAPRGGADPGDELLQKLWGRREGHRDRTVDVFVRKLRDKIDRKAPRHTFIQTRYGVGYKLDPEPKQTVAA